ncbi:MAG: HD-GYP domain-containing protein [Synergistales bacterium]|nr:HD-GYP domain-containing protein [Synergistales bacterium]
MGTTTGKGILFTLPVEELFDAPGIVAEDVVDNVGKLILPQGTHLAWIGAHRERIIFRLRNLGILHVRIRREEGLSTERLRSLLGKISPPLRTVSRQAASETVAAIETAYHEIAVGRNREDLLLPLLRCGKALAGEIGRNPSILFSLLKVKATDEYTFVHSLNVALLAGSLAGILRPGDLPFLKNAISASLLHDLGKARINPAILNKPGKLTTEEYHEVRQHPLIGENLARDSGIAEPQILQAIRWHHERWTGGGYPDNLLGGAIPLVARTIAVADVFDALTAERAYKGALPPREALSTIIESSGAHFDPAVSRCLLRSLGLFPPGTLVELSDETIAVVVSSTEGDLIRPTVLLHFDAKGVPFDDAHLVDLRRSSLHIRRGLGHLGKQAV